MTSKWLRRAGPDHGLRRVGIVALALLSMLGSGCGGKKKIQPPPAPAPAPIVLPAPEKPAPVLQIDLSAASNANRGPSGKGLPVVVRLYQLAAQGAFGSADFFSLYNDQAGVLSGELVASEELSLAPGTSRSIVKPLSPNAGYFGALAAFRDIDNAQWRAIVAASSGCRQ